MNNQFLQHLTSITPQGRAKDTNIFIPAEEIQEGSRGAARHERRIASLERKRKDLFGYLDRPRGTRISAEQEREAQKRSVDPTYQAKRAKYRKLAKDLPSADYAQIARERRRAGLSSVPPTRSMKGSIDRTGSPRITSSPTFKPESDSGYVAPRVPKKVLKYRETSKFKGQVGKAAKRKTMSTNEAVSTNDPNRGRMGRAKPKLPPGLDPYDMYSKGEIRPYGGKLQKRIASMSSEDRKRYYREIGIRSRAASRSGKTQRLFPMTEQEKPMTEAKKPLKKLKRVIKKVKKAVKGAYNVLSTPQDNADYMMTGRKF